MARKAARPISATLMTIRANQLEARPLAIPTNSERIPNHAARPTKGLALSHHIYGETGVPVRPLQTQWRVALPASPTSAEGAPFLRVLCARVGTTLVAQWALPFTPRVPQLSVREIKIRLRPRRRSLRMPAVRRATSQKAKVAHPPKCA